MARNEFGMAICDALGLKQVVKLDISMGVSQLTTVTAVVLVPDEGALKEVVKRFTIEAKPVEEQSAGL